MGSWRAKSGVRNSSIAENGALVRYFWVKKVYTSAGKNYAIPALPNDGKKKAGKHKFILTPPKSIGTDL